MLAASNSLEIVPASSKYELEDVAGVAIGSLMRQLLNQRIEGTMHASFSTTNTEVTEVVGHQRHRHYGSGYSTLVPAGRIDHSLSSPSNKITKFKHPSLKQSANDQVILPLI